MRKIIYVAGSENTGTRYLSSIISKMDHIEGLNADKHEQDLDDIWNLVQNTMIDQAATLFNSAVQTDKDILTRRSYPHGARPIWYSIKNLQKLADKVGRELVVLVTTRDINMLNLSLCRVDKNKNPQIAFDRIQTAYNVIFNDLLNSNIKYAILNYETLMLLGYTYYQLVLESVGIEVNLDPSQVEVRDGNRKYLNNEDLPTFSDFKRLKIITEELVPSAY